MRRPPAAWSVIVSAEHGGNDVPPEHRPLFRGHEALLASHRGWDPGTLSLAETLSAALGAPAFTSVVTRLLVDLNRSAHNPRVFSEITRPLPRRERAALLERYHAPHWERVRRAVSRGIADRGRVLHLSVHSFTAVLLEKPRKQDVALLYDPGRPAETRLARAWAEKLSEALPERAVRRNSPYRGVADGLTSALRRSFDGARYVGVEIEVSQRYVGPDGAFPEWVSGALLGTLCEVIGR